ncbi:MAG: hypothetical protein RR862_03865 [Eggerthellaceae bacterium]
MPDYKLDQAQQATPTTAELQPRVAAPRSLGASVLMVIAGIVVALIGIPLLILPGPGVALIVGGLLLAGSGTKSLINYLRPKRL